MIDINLNLFVAQETKAGYTWTLASRLGQMLTIAQELFGGRDLSYTILGIEFSADGPRIWYPGNCKNIVIQLGIECLNDSVRACYQLAHESIHLLSPSGGQNATVLEEGLATYFSHFYVKQQFGVDYHPSLKSYSNACSHVEALLNIDPNTIKKLRQEQPSISLISQNMILNYHPTLPDEVAQILARSFTEYQSNFTP